MNLNIPCSQIMRDISDKDISIVIVDDMLFSRAVVRSTLNRAGYMDIRLAENGKQALDMLDERKADVVLADWVMPEMDGLELTKRIRNRDNDNGIYTAVVLFTAQEGIERLEEAFKAGVDDYLHKPPESRELVARLGAASRIASLQNSLLETSQKLSNTVQQLKELALIDSLTSTGNRKLLLDQLNAHLLHVASRKSGICFAMIDIDHFSDINERHGTGVGDEVLIEVVRRLRRTVRPTDLICRIGGQEFAVIMHYANSSTFQPSSIQRLLHAVGKRPFITKAGKLNVTISIGTAFYNGAGEKPSVQDMIKLADDKLSQAKEDGRNLAVW